MVLQAIQQRIDPTTEHRIPSDKRTPPAILIPLFDGSKNSLSKSSSFAEAVRAIPGIKKKNPKQQVIIEHRPIAPALAKACKLVIFSLNLKKSNGLG